MLISLIIPCYNEEAVLKLLFKELQKISIEMRTHDFEFLFINDGSSDGTLKILKEFSQEDSRVFYYSFSRNFGKEAAMFAGFCNAKGDYISVMDADMQDPPDLLPQMVSLLESGEYHSVATRRVSRKGEPLIRSVFARIFYKLINKISDADIVDGARDFRLMKRDMVNAIIQMGEYNRFSKGIFGWVGFKTYWLPYENIERAAGATKWSFWKLFKYSIDGIINFSQTPLAIASWFGIFLTALAFFMVFFIIIRKFMFGDPVAGWASLACIITFIGGVELFCIGIIGQYLSKAYLEVKSRPHYIVSDTNNSSAKRIG